MQAFIDESFGEIHGRRTYILSAACVEDDAIDLVRATLLDLNPGEGKLHWRRERIEFRRRALLAMSRLPATFLVVTRTSSLERPERQRRLCLQTLVTHLDTLDVRLATLESRGATGDRFDREALDWRARVGQSHVRIRHWHGALEPVLWMADFVCSAIWAGMNGSPHFTSVLDTMQVTIVHIPE